MDLDLATVDRLLTTTRGVRKRLDFDLPVPRATIEQCLRLALQAPSGGNTQNWRWLVVTDDRKRAALADIYRANGSSYLSADHRATDARERLRDSAAYLAEHLHRVPVHVIPCVIERQVGNVAVPPLGLFGSIFPAIWSFQLALRSRGLGTVITALHLANGGDRQAAELLGIPSGVVQAGLLPVAYYTGTTFKPGPRRPLEEVTYWETWGASHSD